MDKPFVYEIHFEGQLSECWSSWFEGLVIKNESNGETTLSGLMRDQAALFGVLNQIHALNLTLTSVNRLSSETIAE